MEPDEITGRPDETWTDGQKAEYEALKAKYLAQAPEELTWPNGPSIPFDQVIEVLDRLEREGARS